MHVRSLAIRSTRNLARVDLELSPRLTVVSGDNGHGKTSILEAMYVASTTRSFRTTRLREIVGHGADAASVRMRVVDGPVEREQLVGVERGKKRILLDDKPPESLASYAARTPVVVFHPGELELSTGSASLRRTLLDRVALFVDPSSLDHARRFAHAAKSRMRVLATRGETARELDAFEALAARHGAELSRARSEAASRLAARAVEAFARITRESLAIAVAYAPGGADDEAALALQLRGSRERDKARGSAQVGPGRDDLAITLRGRPLRAQASQGEHRAVTLALKLAEMQAIAEARGVVPVLLLDDVSSELDPLRTASLFDLLGGETAQVLLTTTRPELIETPEAWRDRRLDVRIVHGAVAGVSGGS